MPRQIRPTLTSWQNQWRAAHRLLNNKEQLQHRKASVCASQSHPNYRHARKPGYRKHGGVWDGDLHWEPDAVHPLRRRHPRTFNLFSDAIKYKPITLQHERPPSLPSTRHTFVAVRGPDEPLPRTPDTLYTFSHSHTLLVFRLAAPSSTLCRRLRMPG